MNTQMLIKLLCSRRNTKEHGALLIPSCFLAEVEAIPSRGLFGMRSKVEALEVHATVAREPQAAWCPWCWQRTPTLLPHRSSFSQAPLQAPCEPLSLHLASVPTARSQLVSPACPTSGAPIHFCRQAFRHSLIHSSNSTEHHDGAGPALDTGAALVLCMVLAPMWYAFFWKSKDEQRNNES